MTVGCGAGMVLAELQPHLPSDCVCWGYDVSPDALAMSARRGNEKLHFASVTFEKKRATFTSICFSCWTCLNMWRTI